MRGLLQRRRVLFSVMAGGLFLLALTWFSAKADEPAGAREYPWTVLCPENDSRNPDMRDRDEEESRNTVEVLNNGDPLFNHLLTWKKTSILNLLSQQAPFCEMHFDAVKPFMFTAQEKGILTEYLKRGGFIIFFIDAYPYTEDEFWVVKEWPVMDFLTKELPKTDPDFTVGKATDASPVFKVHHQTTTADEVKHELTGNPNTPNRTMLFYKGRLSCFVMGDYTWLGDDGKWVAFPRPYPRHYSLVPKSYQLMANVYAYSMVR
jgi:hypothetical protein